MRYVGLTNKALCRLPMFLNKLFDIVTFPAFPFDAIIWKAVASLVIPLKSMTMTEQFKTVMLDSPPSVRTRTALLGDANLVLEKLDSSIVTFPLLRMTFIVEELDNSPTHSLTETFLRVKCNFSGPEELF